VDSLRAMVYTIILMLSINSVCYMMEYVGMAYIDPYADHDVSESVDPSGIIDSFSDTDPQFYNLAASIIGLWTLIKGLVLGFPSMLYAFGVPNFIAYPLYVVFSAICYIGFTVGLMGGRST
jgi:hypothetical protein